LINPDDIILNNLLPSEKYSQNDKRFLLSDNKSDGRFAVVTLHRPSNVDKKEIFEPILRFIADEAGAEMPVIWPVHPRTRKMMENFNLWEYAESCKNLILLHPLGYHEMLRLNMSAAIIMTDSGGLQEECCVLGTPCLTLRWNTERPVTLREHGGVSVLTGNNIDRIRREYRFAMERGRTSMSDNAAASVSGGLKSGIADKRSDDVFGGPAGVVAKLNRPGIPELWDGKTAMRCVEAIVEASS